MPQSICKDMRQAVRHRNDPDLSGQGFACQRISARFSERHVQALVSARGARVIARTGPQARSAASGNPAGDRPQPVDVHDVVVFDRLRPVPWCGQGQGNSLPAAMPRRVSDAARLLQTRSWDWGQIRSRSS